MILYTSRKNQFKIVKWKNISRDIGIVLRDIVSSDRDIEVSMRDIDLSIREHGVYVCDSFFGNFK